jgi:hypothetical protein
MRGIVNLKERVATFKIQKIAFFAELQPGGSLHNILDVICTKYLPGLEQLLLGRF